MCTRTDILYSMASARNNVRVWAEPNNGAPRLISETNMRKLTSFFPAVKRALLAHRANGGGYIEDVILPSRSLEAYKKIVGG